MPLNNPILYNAALTGFVTGISVTRGFAASLPSGSGPINASAQAFATKVDTAIPTDPSISTSKGILLEAITIGFASLRAITPLLLQATVDLVVEAYQTAVPSLANVNDILGSASPVVFKPGVPSSGSTYATAAEIATALNAVNGALFVYIDASLEACVIPDGVVWDMQNTGSIVGLSSEAGALTIEDGGQIRNPSIIDAVTIAVVPHTLPSFDYDDWTDAPVLNIVNFGSIFYDPSSTIPWINVPNTTSENSFYVQLLQSGEINGGAPAGGIALEGGTGGAGSGASIFFVIDFLTIPFNPAIVSGDTTTTMAWNADASGFPVPAWTAFTGDFTVYPVDNAQGSFYTPAVSGHWVGPAPTTVQQALDRIAANTTNTHPIP